MRERKERREKKRRKKKKKEKTRAGGGSEGSRKDWAELYGCIKVTSSQVTSHCNGNHSKTSVSLSV